MVFFCTFIAISWAFAGAQFVSNAAFNNLGRANLSTMVQLGQGDDRHHPLRHGGRQLRGPEGVLAGTAVGSIIFGVASVYAAFRIVGRLAQQTSQGSEGSAT